MKVLSVVGARPQFIKVKPMHTALQAQGIDHIIVHTGQHYDEKMSTVFFEGLGLPPVAVNLGVGSGLHGRQTGAMLEGLESVFIEENPSWVLVYGDTNSTVAAALAASKLELKVVHIEAGLRSFDRAMPEEVNRVLTDHASDLLMAPTDLAMTNLATEGLASRSVLVGDVMADLFKMTKPLLRPGIASEIAGIDGDYLAATIHRAANTNNEAQLRQLVWALASLELPVLLVAHPRLISAARNFKIDLGIGAIRLLEPLDYITMLSVVSDARGLVTDSGGLQKEAFLLGISCTTLRSETEWPETLVGGMNVLDPQGANLADFAARFAAKPKSQPFGDGHAAERIVRVLVNQ